MLPRVECRGGFLEGGKRLPLPQFLVVDPMAALDFAVLLGASRRDVAMANAGGLHREGEGERPFCPVVRLHLSNRKRQGGAELPQKRQTRSMIELSIQPEDAKPR